MFENKKPVERQQRRSHVVQYLQTAVPHAKAHGVHVDVIRQSRPRRFTVILRELFHKRRWSALVFED